MSEDVVVKGIDVLVLGGGLAGVFAALKAKEAGAARVIQVDKCFMGRSGCSAFAAGVIRYFVPEEDDYDAVFREAVERSGYLCDQEKLADHLHDFADRVREMDAFGVEFEKTADGKLDRQAGRGKLKRIMFRGGFQLMWAMRKAAFKRGVEIVDRVMITDLLRSDGRVAGAVGFDTRKGRFHVFLAKAVVLAMGGTYYKGRRPGQRNVTGDGLAAAYRAGVTLTGFDGGSINTGPAAYDIGPGNNMLMGAGAMLVNARGERFVHQYDPELQERTELDYLTASCALQARQGNTPLFLDLTHVEPEKVERMKRVIPLPMRMYERAGIVVGSRFVKRIEWVIEYPSCTGGLQTNRRYESTLSGLFACGDAMARAGGGGQEALGGAATSGARAGLNAAEYARQVPEPEVEEAKWKVLKGFAFRPLHRNDGVEPDQVLLAVQEAIAPYDVLALRHEIRMEKALRKLEGIWENQVPLLCAYDLHYLRMALEARNMVLIAILKLKSAQFRKESRQVLREDYPFMDNQNWVSWVALKKEGGQMRVDAEGVSFEGYRLRPKPEKLLHPLWQAAQKAGAIRLENEEVSWA